MLRILGLSAVEQKLYEALAADPSMTGVEIDTLGAELGWSAHDRGVALDRLRELGLVSDVSTEDHGYSAAPPYSAFDALLATRAAELKRARDRMLRLSSRFHQHTKAGDTDIEVVRGHAEITRCLTELNRGISRSVIGFDAPPYIDDMASTGVGNVVDVVRPDVTYRTLYDPRSLSIRGRVGNLASARRTREQVRIARLPVKFFVLDGRVAVLRLDHVTFPTDALLVVHDPHLLAALTALFETYWSRAVPMHVAPGESESRGIGLPDRERELLAQLVAGFTDRTIADQLGCGERTVRRRIAGIMRRLGAENRFQAGYHAVARGWVTRQENDHCSTHSIRSAERGQEVQP